MVPRTARYVGENLERLSALQGIGVRCVRSGNQVCGFGEQSRNLLDRPSVPRWPCDSKSTHHPSHHWLLAGSVIALTTGSENFGETESFQTQTSLCSSLFTRASSSVLDRLIQSRGDGNPPGDVQRLRSREHVGIFPHLTSSFPAQTLSAFLQFADQLLDFGLQLRNPLPGQQLHAGRALELGQFALKLHQSLSARV